MDSLVIDWNATTMVKKWRRNEYAINGKRELLVLYQYKKIRIYKEIV